MAQHLWPVAQRKPRTMKQDYRKMTKFHPALRPPSQKLNCLRRQMIGSDDCSGTVVFFCVLIDDQPAFVKLLRHSRAWVRRRVLNVRPIDVALGEFEISLDRLTRVSGIADDEPADSIHFVLVQGLDSLDSGIADVISLFTTRVFGSGPQEVEIIMQDVLDAEKNVAEAR